MKFALSAFVATVAAESFPAFDSFHAHCGLNLDVQADCGTVYSTISSLFQNKFQDPAGGNYQLKSLAQNKSVWVTRETLNKKYVDDNLFQISGSNSNGTCHVLTKSRS